MTSLIDKIKNSTPTHTGDKAWAMLCDVFTREDYVVFSSTIHGMEEVTELAVKFINIIAIFETNDGQQVKIHDPLFISHGVFPSVPSATFYLMYYSNGHIVYIENNGLPELMVLLEKNFLDIQGIEYKDIRCYVADAFQLYLSLPEEQRTSYIISKDT